MKNVKYINEPSALILAMALIFIIISMPTHTVFAQQPDSTKLSQMQVEEQQYPAPDEFVIIDTGPVPKYAPEPEYPEQALKEKIEGVVWIRVLVDKSGNVVKSIIVKESGKNAGFEESALKNAKLRKYKPAELNGEPLAVWIAYRVEFKLK